MNELKIHRFGAPAFRRRQAPRWQAEQLEAFKNAVRNADIKWVVTDYPADKACSLREYLGALLARLNEYASKVFTAR